MVSNASSIQPKAAATKVRRCAGEIAENLRPGPLAIGRDCSRKPERVRHGCSRRKANRSLCRNAAVISRFWQPKSCAFLVLTAVEAALGSRGIEGITREV